MARTLSNMLSLGTTMPDFELFDVVKETHLRLSDLEPAKGYLIMFICNHCPFVKHIEDQLIKLGTWCQPQGVIVLGISSNDIEEYPADAPDKMKDLALQKSYPFPYLFDESQDVAKAFNAACTPDFYLFDSEKKLVYRGQLDDSRPGSNIPVTGTDIREAILNLLSNSPISNDQKPSLGCNIKWKN